MPKSFVLGNGNVLVGYDHLGQVRDFYFPYVGLENQVGGLVHRIGVWADGEFHWFANPSWKISVNCASETFAGRIEAVNEALGVRLDTNDIVYNEKNIFVRKFTLRNLRKEKRLIKIFFNHEFELYSTFRGDTAYYDPRHNVIIHYEGRRVFLINARAEARGFDDYTTGLFQIEGKEGTFKDAEDGVLAKNAIEHGRVDSTIGISFETGPEEEHVFYYWITVAESIHDAYELNHYVLERHPQHLIQTTQDFWRAWVNKQNFTFHGLDEKIVETFKKSLFMIRAHTDNGGAIIASSDSDMLQYGRDTYSYVWPRDASISAIALDKAGDANITRRFFKFCNRIISDDGYFMHKYRSDGSLGSSWHPWLYEGKMELPIQEDETALVICALWKHYEATRDLEFIEDLYNPLIKKAADFMMNYINPETGLPLSSYDLWEEKYGVSTFTASTVYGALTAAAKFARLLGKVESEQTYLRAAEKMKEGIIAYLYNENAKMFYKLALPKDGKIKYDETLDMSSIHGIVQFGVLDPDDLRVKDSFSTVMQKLCCKTPIGGIPRYEGDRYYQTNSAVSNPWFVTTLWLAQYHIAIAKKEEDLEEVKKLLAWVSDHTLPSGVLSEQLNPETGAQISAAPLTWSHSEFVITVVAYLEKLEELGICKACATPKTVLL